MTFKRLEGPAGDVLAMVTVVVVGTGLTVDRSVSEDVVDHAQPGVRHVHDGFLRPALPQYRRKRACRALFLARLAPAAASISAVQPENCDEALGPLFPG